MKIRQFIRTTGVLLVSIFYSLFCYSQNHNGKLDLAEEWAEKITIPFTMPDCTILMTDVYLPVLQDSLSIPVRCMGNNFSIEILPGGTQYILFDSLDGKINEKPYELPVIFIRTPYNKDTEALGYFLSFLGYAVVIQDNRGCYDSEGVYLAMYSDSWKKDPYHGDIQHLLDITQLNDRANANLHEDGYQSINFIIDSLQRIYLGDTMNVCNGMIGMFGASALGNVQYQLASAHKINPENPGLKCLFPIVATNEHYRFTAVQNGVFREQLVTGWISQQYNTLITDHLSDQDPSIFNAIHSPADFNLNNKSDITEKGIDYWLSYKPDGGPSGYYPNSVLRSDLDASAAVVNSAGEGAAKGAFSRYANMEVPGYHLTGWWDIFIDGQIETYNQLMNNLIDEYGNKNLQKLVIGPWAHQTVTQKSTGDVEYPDNVQDFLFNLSNVELNLDDFPIGELYGSEPMQWFRSNLNHNSWKNTGDPKVIIPESNTWHSLTQDIKIRIPSVDVILPYHTFLNFLSANVGLDSIPYGLSNGDNEVTGYLIIPRLDSALIRMGKLESGGQTDFSLIPNVRLYVTGSQKEQIGNLPPAGNYWFESDSFPFTKDILWQKLYLHEDQMLFSKEPDSPSGSSSYIHDPENPVFTVGGANMIIQTPQWDRKSQGQMNLADPHLAPYTMDRNDVLSFESNPLRDTLSIIGFPVARIFASSLPVENFTDSTSTDFFVRILDVSPDSGEYFVVEGAVNARARNYAKQLATGPEDPSIPFTNIVPGELYEYLFKMMPIAYTFGIGHRIKLLISSSNHPRYQSNPNLPVNQNEFFRWKPGSGLPSRKALQTIYFSKDAPSNIILPVYKGRINLPVTAIKDPGKENRELRVFPNPASDFTHIQTRGVGNTLEVYHLTGRKIFTEVIDEEYLLDVGEWAPGAYILQLSNKKTNTFLSRMIIVQ